MPSRLLFLALTVSLSSACTETLMCTNGARPSVQVRIEDRATGANLIAGARLIQSNGAVVDSTVWPSDGPADDRFVLAVQSFVETPGTYSLTVRRDGYAEWTRAGVEVAQGRCGVYPVELTARMDAAP